MAAEGQVAKSSRNPPMLQNPPISLEERKLRYRRKLKAAMFQRTMEMHDKAWDECVRRERANAKAAADKVEEIWMRPCQSYNAVAEVMESPHSESEPMSNVEVITESTNGRVISDAELIWQFAEKSLVDEDSKQNPFISIEKHVDSKEEIVTYVQQLQDAAVAFANRTKNIYSTKPVASGAATGAAFLGVAGSATGGAVGCLAGVIASMPIAFFTFGLSIPAGALIGAGAGACVGAATGGTAGAASGAAVGYFCQQAKCTSHEGR